MGGFFGFFDYNKPGKGVDVDAPPKARFFLFFELLWRKFSRFAALNLFLFAILIPIITALFLGYYSLADQFLPEGALDIQAAQDPNAQPDSVPFSMLPTLLFTFYFRLPKPLSQILLAASVVCYGPAMCGMTYCLRNYAREEHAWFSDFFVRMKRNFLQGAIAGIVEIVVLFLLFYNITTVLGENATAQEASMLSFVRLLSLAMMLVLFFMRHYVYLLIVTFDLKLRQVWKNSFIFGILNLWRNMLVSVIVLALVVVVLVVPYMDIVLVPFIFLSFTGFLTLFVCMPIVYRYMVRTETEDDGEAEADALEALPENGAEEAEPATEADDAE